MKSGMFAFFVRFVILFIEKSLKKMKCSLDLCGSKKNLGYVDNDAYLIIKSWLDLKENLICKVCFKIIKNDQ